MIKKTVKIVLLLVVVVTIALVIWAASIMIRDKEPTMPSARHESIPLPTPEPGITELSACEISVSIPTPCVYTGRPKTIAVMITDGSYALVRDKDYTVTSTDVINAGEAMLTIVGRGKYLGMMQYPFQIEKAHQNLFVSVSHDTIPCGGTAQLSVVGIGDVHYTSNNEENVKVNMHGKLYAIAPGMTSITITADGDQNHYGAEKTINVAVIEE